MMIDMRKMIGWVVLISMVGCVNRQKAIDSSSGSDCELGTVLILKDYSELDGCTWLFEDNEGDKYQPLNLNEHVKSPKTGVSYKVLFNIEKGGPNICMAGKMISIGCLKRIN